MSIKYFIKEDFGNNSTAATKAPSDLQEIFIRNKFVELVKIKKENRKYKKYASLLKSFISSVSKLKKGDVLIFQFPFATGTKFKMILLRYCKIKKIKVIFLMNDLESLRYNVDTLKIIKKEKYINLADVIICHNRSMKEYLISCGISREKLIELEIFDYLADISEFEEKKNSGIEVSIAGNLAKVKSGYIYKLIEKIEKITLNLYGPNFSPENEVRENIRYKGSVNPNRLPVEIKGDYGLIWDGDEITTCSGITGNYLRYNNPHKTSLFLVAGMPIIVWKYSAMREFVERNRIGIVIEDLNKLEERLVSVSAEEYNTMKNNVSNISFKLRSGYYTTNAIKKAVYKLENSH